MKHACKSVTTVTLSSVYNGKTV